MSERTSWALPFEALYQDALQRLTADARGATRFAVELGPFGGGQEYGTWLPGWAVVYLIGVLGIGAWGFARKDL